MSAPVVACIKVGPKYGPEYVSRLAAMVARHAPEPLRFVCLTDDPTGLTCETAPIGTALPGAWAQLVLFRPHPALTGERVLYLDLDTVIVGSLAPLLAYSGPFAIVRDWWQPRRYRGAAKPLWTSCVMSIAPGFGRAVWDRIEADPDRLARGPLGVRFYLTDTLPAADLWQDIAPGCIGSYKADKLQAGPRGFAVVAFHGYPKMPDLLAGHWARVAWEGSA